MRIRTFDQFLAWLDLTYEDPYFTLPDIPLGWFEITKARQKKMKEEARARFRQQQQTQESL